MSTAVGDEGGFAPDLKDNEDALKVIAEATSAAGYELATREAVMAIGGFNGSDPAPSLAQFQAYVAAGQVHYFIAGGMRGSGAGSGNEIATWVAQHFTATTVDGVTVFDLTQTPS